MTDVILLDPVSDTRWDPFVENHPYGWICHLSGWKHVLEKSFKQMKGYYLTLEDNNRIKAALPIYEIKSIITGKRLVSIPFATLSDPLVTEPNDMKKLNSFSIRTMLQILLIFGIFKERSFNLSTDKISCTCSRVSNPSLINPSGAMSKGFPANVDMHW